MTKAIWGMKGDFKVGAKIGTIENRSHRIVAVSDAKSRRIRRTAPCQGSFGFKVEEFLYDVTIEPVA